MIYQSGYLTIKSFDQRFRTYTLGFPNEEVKYGFINFFADFPYELNEKTERHYQVVFYLVFKLMGQFTQAEVRTAIGRADAVVKTADYIYVFEFKLTGTAEEALKQIDEKGYLLPYTVDGRRLVKVGVSFDAAKRNLGEWLIV